MISQTFHIPEPIFYCNYVLQYHLDDVWLVYQIHDSVRPSRTYLFDDIYSAKDFIDKMVRGERWT